MAGALQKPPAPVILPFCSSPFDFVKAQDMWHDLYHAISWGLSPFRKLKELAR